MAYEYPRRLLTYYQLEFVMSMKTLLTKGFKKDDSLEFQRPPVEDTVDVTEQHRASLRDMDDLDDEVAALEAQVQREAKKDPQVAAANAAEELRTFPMSRLASKLIDEAMVNVSNNTGANLPDEDARFKAAAQAALVKAAGCNLTDTVLFLSDAVEPTSIGNAVYSFCFQVMKACMFIGNMQYRRALDPSGEYDLEKYVDYREDQRTAPYGLGKDMPDEFDHGLEAFQQIERALQDIRDYLQLLSESFGWDPDQPMPFIFTSDDDGITFKGVHDVGAALDITQVKSAASRAKRNQRQGDAMLRAAAAARASLLARK